jgi:GNAT superfamily N-acetyltransferase
MKQSEMSENNALSDGKPMPPGRIAYRLLGPADGEEVSALVGRVFDEFVAPEFSSEGVCEFRRYILPEAFRERARADHLGLIARGSGGGIAGMIEVRGFGHISLLFVLPEYQRRGIARELFRRAAAPCRRNNPAFREISVHSSSFAVPAYEKLGFRRTGKRQTKNGITFIPMAMAVSGTDEE